MSRLRCCAAAVLTACAMILSGCLADELMPLEITTETSIGDTESLETLPVYELDTETEAPPVSTQVETTEDIEETVPIDTTSTTETTHIPETTSEPETTAVPETTLAPETTAAPETTTAINQEQTVYWVKNGEVWHISINCPSLARSKNILSGSLDDAMAAGKERACKRCG